MAKLEKLDGKDLAQTAVGAFTGALIYGYEIDLSRLSDSIPEFNIILIVLCTLALSLLINYSIGVRRLGKRQMRFIVWPIPLRLVVHYGFALVFSALILGLLAINLLSTPWYIALKRVIVLALPATVFGSAVDLIGSQKAK